MYRVVIDNRPADEQKTQILSESFTAYLCRDPWEPKGICVGKDCDADISVDVKSITRSIIRTTISFISGDTVTLGLVKNIPDVKRAYVYFPMAKNDSTADKNVVSMYLFKNDINSPNCLVGRACQDFLVNDYLKWAENKDGEVHVAIPIPQFCGLKNLLVVFGVDNYREIWPGNDGEIKSDSMELAIGAEYYDRYTQLSTKLIAGDDYPVFYISRAAGDDYHYLSKFRFETSVLTSAKVEGCGLVDDVAPVLAGNVTFYTDLPAPQTHINEYWLVSDSKDKPAGIYLSSGAYWKNLGGVDYKVETFVHGGKGYSYKTFYSGEIDRFRWLVSYRGKYYKIKSTDFTPWKLGTTVYIIKNIADNPVSYDQITDSATTHDLSDADEIARIKIQRIGAETDDQSL